MPSQRDKYVAVAVPVSANPEADSFTLGRQQRPTKGRPLLRDGVDPMRLSTTGYHRLLRATGTLGDLDGANGVKSIQIAETLSYRCLVSGHSGGGRSDLFGRRSASEQALDARLDGFSGGSRVRGLNDGSADNNVISAGQECLFHVDGALLVIDGPVRTRADAGDDDQ